MENTFLTNALEYLDQRYNAKERLIQVSTLQEPERINNIHSKARSHFKKIHSIRSSIIYAYYLLKADRKTVQRAIDVIATVLDFQQNSPLKEYYGLWPYYSEEPLHQMPLPDPNQAAFILSPLLMIYKNHRNRLPADLARRIEQACCAAVIFIVNRNTGLQYSHIVSLECRVCVLCGELFSRPEFINYGMQKIEKFMHYVYANGDFSEFNSPTVSLLMATSFGIMLGNVQNERVLETTRQLNHFLWNSLARHYHFATKQLVGPFSRCYQDFLGKEEMLILDYALGRKNNTLFSEILFSSGNFNVEQTTCPPKFYPFFSGQKTVEYSQRLISHGSSYPFFGHAQIATTYIQPKYALGTFNRHELWEERRPLIAHFGNSHNLYSLRVRCLLNHYDFSSAQLHCVQVKNSVLGHVCFATNRGIQHMDNTNYNGKTEISDLRIRFEINGDGSQLKIKQENHRILVEYDTLLFSFSYDFFQIDRLTPYVTLQKNEDKTAFDLILYRGKPLEFDFTQINCAICQFSLHISEKNHIYAPVENELTDSSLISRQKYGDFELMVKTPVKPDDWIILMLYDAQEINGVKLERYAHDTEESALQYEFLLNSSSEIPISTSEDGTSPVDHILSNIELLSSTPFGEMQAKCDEILEFVEGKNISIDMAKRFAIRMITNIFEVAQNYSLIFENAIKYEYSNIYINLSQNNSIHAIKKTISNTINKLQIDYQLFSENQKKKEFIETVTSIILENYSDPNLSLTFLAEKTGLSEAYISKAFHKRTGISYLQYLTRIRMEHAKELLDNGETGSLEIAKKIGYENVSSFLRSFKKYTGTTVSAYIKNLN